MRNRKSTGDAAALGTVMTDVVALKSDIGALMGHVKTDAAETVQGGARRLYGSLAAEGERTRAAIALQVEERPFYSLLIAFAVGFIGSRLLPR